MNGEILFVTALGWEARQVLRHLSAREPSREENAVLWRATSDARAISVVRTGVGPALATRAIRWAGAIVRPAAVVVTGCAGGLAPACAVGSVVVASEVVAGADRRTWSTSPAWSERYLRAARSASLDARTGRLYTSEAILESPLAKSAVAERLGAEAVDMESSAIAEWAAAENVELAAARVIVDDAATVMPLELATFTGSDGAPNLRRLLNALRHRPRLGRDLAALGRATLRAKRALAALHRELFRDLD
jgi:adenosylhomocysteine nucleosidase